ncbi:hypothetical protein H0H93_002264 [Arthromyces matolae]|nr:hypothetical protein H0H93_002264 [Arthromyces matolae]
MERQEDIPERCSTTMSTIASDLDNITTDSVKFEVAEYLKDNRARYKLIVIGWRLPPSYHHRTAVEAIRKWENEVNKWNRGFPNVTQQIAKFQAKCLLKLVMESPQLDFEDRQKVGDHLSHLTAMISMVLQMTIDDTRELRKELLAAASHVESTLIPACQWVDTAHWEVKITESLQILKGYTRIFVTEFIPSTRS